MTVKAYSHAIGDLLVVVLCNFLRVDHVFANQLDRSVADLGGAVKKMTLDSRAHVFLVRTISRVEISGL